MSLHHQSHGESFLSLLLNRFGGEGLYLLDEPEAALSPARQMTLLARMHELAEQRSQFIIATHSPILMAYPGAEIYVLTPDGMEKTPYEQTEHYLLTRRFLENPGRMLAQLFEEGPGDKPRRRRGIRMKLILQTRRLTLRELEKEDVGALRLILQDPLVMYAWEHAFTGCGDSGGGSKRTRRAIKRMGAVIGRPRHQRPAS